MIYQSAIYDLPVAIYYLPNLLLMIYLCLCQKRLSLQKEAFLHFSVFQSCYL